jgi:hypothetical protein
MFDLPRITALSNKFKFSTRKRFSIRYKIENLELEAVKIFDNFKENDLYNFFKTTIVECLSSTDTLVESYIDNQMELITKEYFQSEYKEQLHLLKKDISMKYRNDKGILKEYLRTNKNNCQNENLLSDFVALKVMDDYNSQFPSIERINYLANFKLNAEYSILYETLFTKNEEWQIFKPSKFEELFISKPSFFLIIKDLIKEKIIIHKNFKYYWKGAVNESKLSDKKLLCTLFNYLYHKDYLDKNAPQQIVNAINEFFQNTNITLTLYLRYKKEFSDPDKRSNSIYYAFFHFIK